ncbi:MAG: matrixin family metalloprotease [Bryobacteraceae bacterium]
MDRSLWRAAGLLCFVTSSSYGAVRWANEAGNPFRRTDFADIHFKLNSATALSLVSDGDPAVAIQAALDAWNAVPHTALHFAPLEATTAGIDPSDRQNVIAFAATPAERSAVGSAAAITVLSYSSDGRVLDSDIILNPAVKFSTTLQPNSYDLQSVLTHEFGHALGANHATITSATMFYKMQLQDNSKAQLKPDDASFAADVYPGPGAIEAYGLITGTATKDGVALPGAAVVAADPSSGIAIGGLSSLPDGAFSLRVPAGNYLLFAAPLTGAITPANLYNVPVAKADTAFKAAVSGGSDNPARIRIEGGATVNADVAAVGGASPLDILTVGKIVTSNGVSSFTIAAPPVVAQAGQALDFIVSGPGLDGSIAEDNLRLIGPGVTIRAGSLRVETRVKDADGRSPLRFTIDIAPPSGTASVSLFIVRGSDTALSAGSLLIIPPKPVFDAANLVDAGSFRGAGIAPGELISLFGAGVGPAAPVGNNGFDPATGALPTALAGLSVTFDGVPAPLIFASNGQVNLQVPYEVAGRASSIVIVRNQGIASDPVSVPVVLAQPGIFMQAGASQAIASTRTPR